MERWECVEDGSGLDLPGGQIGVRLLRGRGECVGGRGEGLDSPGGRIGVSLLTGATFGDRMKKNIFGVFCARFYENRKVSGIYCVKFGGFAVWIGFD